MYVWVVTATMFGRVVGVEAFSRKPTKAMLKKFVRSIDVSGKTNGPGYDGTDIFIEVEDKLVDGEVETIDG